MRTKFSSTSVPPPWRTSRPVVGVDDVGRVAGEVVAVARGGVGGRTPRRGGARRARRASPAPSSQHSLRMIRISAMTSRMWMRFPVRGTRRPRREPKNPRSHSTIRTTIRVSSKATSIITTFTRRLLRGRAQLAHRAHRRVDFFRRVEQAARQPGVRSACRGWSRRRSAARRAASPRPPGCGPPPRTRPGPRTARGSRGVWSLMPGHRGQAVLDPRVQLLDARRDARAADLARGTRRRRAAPTCARRRGSRPGRPTAPASARARAPSIQASYGPSSKAGTVGWICAQASRRPQTIPVPRGPKIHLCVPAAKKSHPSAATASSSTPKPWTPSTTSRMRSAGRARLVRPPRSRPPPAGREASRRWTNAPT